MSTSTGRHRRRLSAPTKESDQLRENNPLANSYASNPIKSLFKKQMALSIRNHSWFRLSRQERSLYSLALRLKVRFESVGLLRALVSVLKKLQQFGRTAYQELRAGMLLAWAFSGAAVSWGNDQARSWRTDQNYIRFLGKLYPGGSLG